MKDDLKSAPRQIVVLSGKGGTGKTTVVGALATLARGAVLADCDVDAADLHLLLSPQRTREESFFAGKEAVIHSDRCCGCGSCAEYCRFDAIEAYTDEKGRSSYRVDPLACEGCGLCSLVCTCDAVQMTEPERGRLFVSSTRHGPLVDARLHPGGDNSGKLVTMVRNTALEIAEAEGFDLILVDGPPGVACPLIASLTGADLLL
jgi:MinD superfamily P-loop ATPase